MPRWVHAILFGLTMMLLGVAVLLSGMAHERNLGLVWLFKMRGPVEPPAEVAVVAIDSGSGPAMELSRLPRNWPRSLHAVMVSRLAASDVRTIVFDMDFSQAREPSADEVFANAIRASQRTVLFERLDGRNERIVSQNGDTRWLWIEESLPPAEPLASAARAIAPFPLPKIDQASYQFWTFKPSADDVPTTPAVAVQLALAEHHEAWSDALESAGVSSEQLPEWSALTVPGAVTAHMKKLRKQFLADPSLAARLGDLLETGTYEPALREAIGVLLALYSGPSERYTNYHGPPGTIRTVPYQDLILERDLERAEVPERIRPTEASLALGGKTVFVGYSDLYSPDQPDRFYTVYTSDRGIDLSGSEIMATAFANLRHDDTIRQPVAWVSLAAVAVFGLIVSQLVFWPSPYVAVPLAVLVAGAYGLSAGHAFANANLWLPLATPVAIQLPVGIVAGLVGQYLLERNKKRRVGAAIAQYLPKHLAEGITEGRIGEASINQVVHGVCLATDMSGFSRISETKSPAELAEFMNAYFDAIAGALKRCQVDVTEFHADTIMCAWLGKPDEIAFRHRAIRAALGVVGAIEEFAADEEDLTLSARVGLQDGPFYLGHTGGGGRLSYSILGNPANSASRLEGLNKKLKTRILAAASVVEGIDDFVVRPLGEFQVFGKSEFVDVVEVMGFRSEPQPGSGELTTAFATALQLFRSERWAEALAAFREVAAQFPSDGPTRFYRKLSKRYVNSGVPEINPTKPAMTSK